MPPEIRRWFPWFMLLASVCAVAWALSFTTIPKADFAFQNGDDAKTLDPGRATGEPERRILNAIFEGLLRSEPQFDQLDDDGSAALNLVPGVSELPEISQDGRTYTFRIRSGAKWSDGSPVTSGDFAWSWQRTLHPETASEYATQLYYLVGGKKYNTAEVAIGDRVEAELRDRPNQPDPLQPFPRGTMLSGELLEIIKPEKPDTSSMDDDASEDAMADWREAWVYKIDVKPQADDAIRWDAEGTVGYYARDADAAIAAMGADEKLDAEITPVHQVLIDFDSYGGVETPDDRTLIVHLNEPTPFFSYLTTFYTLFPVNRQCVVRHGSPGWTKAENIVSNGPYRLEFRRIRDRIRMRKNPLYWDADSVALECIDAYSVKSQNTALNMYLKDQIHWATDLPLSVIEDLQRRPGAKVGDSLSVYFFRLNTSRKPLDDSRVRRALNMAVDKHQIVNEVTRAGQVPAQSVVPPFLTEYQGPVGEAYNPQKARELLAEAGYPGGQGIPTLSILYNTSESHQAIAEVIQQQWQNNLNVKASLENM